MNTVCIAGRIGQDLELRQAGETPVVNLSVATKGYNDETEWFSVVVFGKQAENAAKYLSKGKLVGVTGRLKTRSWEKDGEKKDKTELIASNIEFLSPKSDTANESAVHPGVPNLAPNFDNDEQFPPF